MHRILFRAVSCAIGLICAYGFWRRFTIPGLTADTALTLVVAQSPWSAASGLMLSFLLCGLAVWWWIQAGTRHEHAGRKMPMRLMFCGMFIANPMFWTMLAIPCIYVQSAGPYASVSLLAVSLLFALFPFRRSSPLPCARLVT